jgi:hypothetical protein
MLTQVPIPVLSDRIGRVLDIGLSLAEAFLQREAYRLAHDDPQFKEALTTCWWPNPEPDCDHDVLQRHLDEMKNAQGWISADLLQLADACNTVVTRTKCPNNTNVTAGPPLTYGDLIALQRAIHQHICCFYRHATQMAAAAQSLGDAIQFKVALPGDPCAPAGARAPLGMLAPLGAAPPPPRAVPLRTAAAEAAPEPVPPASATAPPEGAATPEAASTEQEPHAAPEHERPGRRGHK